MNPTQQNMGGSPVYEREGRRFVQAGIGTIGWGVYPLWNEIDFDGNAIGDSHMPEQWIFPDPAVIAAQVQADEEERARLELAAQFPVEGMSGVFYHNTGLTIWPASKGDDDELTVALGSATCDFCGERTCTVTIPTDDYGSLEVCRDCLGKMFDAFEEHEANE